MAPHEDSGLQFDIRPAEQFLKAAEDSPQNALLGEATIDVYEKFTDYIINTSSNDLTVKVTVSLAESVAELQTKEGCSVGGDDTADRFGQNAAGRFCYREACLSEANREFDRQLRARGHDVETPEP